MPRSLDELIARADEIDDAFMNFEPTNGSEEIPATLALQLAAHRRAQAERELAAAVVKARVEESLSWAKVGEAVGTSGEAARQRYGSEIVSDKGQRVTRKRKVAAGKREG